MQLLKSHTVPLHSEFDIVQARQIVRQWSAELRFGVVDQTKIVTAASEIARNTIIYGKGGSLLLEALADGGRHGLSLTFKDQGPGIPDVELALKDGFTTGSGLGLGLGGARRLMSEFNIQTQPGAGTTIKMTRWKG